MSRSIIISFFICIISLPTVLCCCSTKTSNGLLQKWTRVHFYTPDNTHYIILHSDSTSVEINTKTGDSSFWTLRWIDPKRYSSKYLRGKKFNSKEEEIFFKQLEVLFEIVEIKEACYIVAAKSEYKNKILDRSDTVWFDERKK